MTMCCSECSVEDNNISEFPSWSWDAMWAFLWSWWSDVSMSPLVHYWAPLRKYIYVRSSGRYYVFNPVLSSYRLESIRNHVNFHNIRSPARWTAIRRALLWCRYVDRFLRGHMHANVSILHSKVHCDDGTRYIIAFRTDSSIMSSMVHVPRAHSSVYLSFFKLSEWSYAH